MSTTEAITTTIEATTTTSEATTTTITTRAILGPTTRTTSTSAPATSTRASSARTTTIRTTPVPTTSTATTRDPTTTTTTPTTTTTTTTTRRPSRPAPTFEIRAVLFIVFESALTNPQSPEFQQQAAVVENACDVIYRQRFGFLFVRTIVRAFRLATRYRVDNVETDIDVVFNENSIEPLPTSSAVVEALATAVNDSNLGFNLFVVPGSIFMRSEPKSAAIVQFRTNDTFIADLLNSSSVAFSDRSSLIKTELEPFFFEDYQPDFISLTPTRFSNGSIIHEANMTITSDATFPNDTQIIATLTRAALSGNLSFTIIFIDGTAVSAGEVSSSVNLLSACGLTIISLLVAQPW
ncbi:location of vulva defective 1-like [Alosa sapidissima]|uniref:location of vulva defective 1-like n=1 Tax=Alosa sapidissima TaxID=34773 RepID=UPI001C0A4FA4|nr:location of vulva defective 1-like [Alosa sapidissima]